MRCISRTCCNSSIRSTRGRTISSKSDIRSAKEAVKSAIRAVVEYWKLSSTLRKLGTEREALKQRAGALQRTLPNLSEDDQAIVAHFDKANEFNSKLAQASSHSDQIFQRLEAVDMELRNERDLSTELEGTAQLSSALLSRTICCLWIRYQCSEGGHGG